MKKMDNTEFHAGKVINEAERIAEQAYNAISDKHRDWAKNGQSAGLVAGKTVTLTMTVAHYLISCMAENLRKAYRKEFSIALLEETIDILKDELKDFKKKHGG